MRASWRNIGCSPRRFRGSAEVCRLSLRERAPFRGAKGNNTSLQADLVLDPFRNINQLHALASQNRQGAVVGAEADAGTRGVFNDQEQIASADVPQQDLS